MTSSIGTGATVPPLPSPPPQARLADICVLAIAEVFRGDGEIVGNPIGPLPKVAGRLARELVEPRLLLLDRDAFFVGSDGQVEGWNPYARMFDLVWSGRRHVVMGATQIDRFGNQNIAAIGPDPTRPERQLLGFRGAPGNTINHPTSYWVPRHSPRVFVEKVDVVCGIGYDRAAQLGPHAARYHEIRRVVTDLAVLDFATPDRRMRIVSVHPGVTVDQVCAATGFDLVVDGDVPVTPVPDTAVLQRIAALDPDGARHSELGGR